MPSHDHRHPGRRGLLVLVLGLSFAFRPAAAETLLPAAKAFPFLKDYLALAPAARDRFTPAYVLHAKAGSLAGAQGWLVKDGRRTALAISADGQIAPPSRADLEGGQVSFTFAPGAKIGIRVEMVANLPLRAEFPTAALEASLDQANGALHTAIPLVGPPKMIRLEFAGAEDGELVTAGGQHAALPRHDGVAYYEPSAAGRGGTVHLRRPPSRIVLSAAR